MNDVKPQGRATKFRWIITTLLFFATTINYLDRQVLSLTWKDFIAPEFHWTDSDYGTVTGLFSIFYAIAMLFAGKFVDWMDTKKGFLWSIGIWSVGAVLHAFCGIATSGIVAGEWAVNFEGAKETLATVGDVGRIATVSVSLFIFARLVLAIGEAGNFPAAIKTTAEYFPKKDRAFSTSIFNAGAQIGALLAPITIPFIAQAWGWEMAFVIIGATGFVWMFFWIFLYDKPEQSKRVNAEELAYIQQDDLDPATAEQSAGPKKKISFAKAFSYKQTWAFALGKFMTDGVWWFFLFWAPAYLKSVYGLSAVQSAQYIFVLYAITMLSIIGGWLPSYFVDKKGMNPYAGRMKAMLIFAFFPLLALLAQPLGHISIWIPVIIIGIAGAAHQAWSANIFSTIGDMFPKYAVATITGIGGMAGGIGAFIINKGSGVLFDYAAGSTMVEGKEVTMSEELFEKGAEFIRSPMGLFGFEGREAGYFIIFCICGVAYLIGWLIMKSLVPVYKPITDL